MTSPLPALLGGGGETGLPQVMTGPSMVTIPGLGSLPPKLAKRIVQNDFVDMRELLPESWRVETQQANGSQKMGPLLGPITDFQLFRRQAANAGSLDWGTILCCTTITSL